MNRRWHPGTFEVSGLRWQIRVGGKHALIPGTTDLVLDVWTLSGWREVPMALNFFLTDFFFENEEVLYPSKANGGTAKGGVYHLQRLKFASEHGWERAVKLVEMERIVATRQEKLPW